jgi:hypothetical protein
MPRLTRSTRCQTTVNQGLHKKPRRFARAPGRVCLEIGVPDPFWIWKAAVARLRRKVRDGIRALLTLEEP